MRDHAAYLMDPHTATGYVAADKTGLDPAIPQVLLSTAAPAKFPDAMKAVAHVDAPLPPRLAHLLHDAERMEPVANDLDALQAYIRRHARAVQG